MTKVYTINPLPSHGHQPHRLGHRNCVVGSDGSLQVRPAYTSLLACPDGSEWVFGFSLRDPNTGDYAHYIGERVTSSQVLTLKIYDEQFTQRHSYQIGKVANSRVVATPAVIVSPTTANLEVLITSPHFNSLYGVLGGSVTAASAVASVNPGTTTLDMPNGIAVGVGGRAIVAKGRVLLVSDARAPRSFTGINASGFDGIIYGLHKLPGGNLAIVTDTQTYYLPADAFFQGQQVAGVFEPLASYGATDYQQTTVSDGRLFGLSRHGIREINNGMQEIGVDDPHMPLRMVQPISQNDYRASRLFADDRGPVIVPPGDTRSICEFDIERGFYSWQEVASGYSLNVVGILKEREGNSLLVTGSQVLRAYGNSEWSGGDVWGTVLGSLATAPGESLVARYVTASGDSPGSQRVSVRAGTPLTKTQPQTGAQEGTSTWGSATLETQAIRSRRTDWAVRSDSITVEAQQQHPGTHIGKIEVVTRGIGKRRRTN